MVGRAVGIVKEGESTAQRTAAKSAVLQNKPEGVRGRVDGSKSRPPPAEDAVSARRPSGGSEGEPREMNRCFTARTVTFQRACSPCRIFIPAHGQPVNAGGQPDPGAHRHHAITAER